MKLIDALNQIKNDGFEGLLGDGAQNWEIDNLIEYIHAECDEDYLNTDVNLGYTTDGRYSIKEINADGYENTVALYQEVRNEQ